MAYELVINDTLANYKTWQETVTSSEITLGLWTLSGASTDPNKPTGKFSFGVNRGRSKSFDIYFLGDGAEAETTKFRSLLAPLIQKGFITLEREYTNAIYINLEGINTTHIAEPLLELLPLLDTIDGQVPFSAKSYLCKTYYGSSSFNLFNRYKGELESRLTKEVVFSKGKATLTEDKFIKLLDYAKNAGHPALLLCLANTLEENYGLLDSAAIARIRVITQPKVPQRFLVQAGEFGEGKEAAETLQTGGTDGKVESEAALLQRPEFKVAKALLDGSAKIPASDLELVLREGFDPGKRAEGSTLLKLVSFSWVVFNNTTSSTPSKEQLAQERRSTLVFVHTLLENFKNTLVSQGMKNDHLKAVNDLLLVCAKELGGQSDLTRTIPLKSASAVDLLEHMARLNDKITTTQALLKEDGQKKVAGENDTLKNEIKALQEERARLQHDFAEASKQQQQAISQLQQENAAVKEAKLQSERENQTKQQALTRQLQETKELQEKLKLAESFAEKFEASSEKRGQRIEELLTSQAAKIERLQLGLSQLIPATAATSRSSETSTPAVRGVPSPTLTTALSILRETSGPLSSWVSGSSASTPSDVSRSLVSRSNTSAPA